MPLYEDFFINAVQPMTDVAQPPPQVASASSEDTGYPAWHAFDHSTTSRWRSTKFEPSNVSSESSSHSFPAGSISSSTMEYIEGEWLKIDFGVLQHVRHYELIVPRTENAPKSWTMEGSVDGTNWDIINKVVDTYISPDDESPIYLMFIIDTSGSMSWESPTRLTQVKTSLNSFIDTAPTRITNMSVVGFQSTISGSLVFTTNRTAVKNKINSLVSNGGTNYTTALEFAKNIWDTTTFPSGCKKVAFFLSDGVPNPPDANGLAWTSSYHAANININTCGFGTGGEGSFNPVLLQQIAAETDGSYYFAPSGDDLSEILDGVFNTATFYYECVNPENLYHRYYRLNIWANQGDTNHTEIIEWRMSGQNLGECENSSSSASLSTLSSQGLTSASSVSSESSSSQSYSSRSSVSSISSSSMSSSSSSSPSSASSSSSSSSISSSTSSSTSISSASSISSSSSSSSSSSVYKALVDSYRENLTYLSYCTDTDSITNPEVGDSGLMTVAGFLDSDSTTPTYVEPEFVHTYMGGLKKTVANKGLIYCLDAQRFLSMRGGMVRLFLKLPYKIQDGVYAPLENKEDSYLQDLIIWAVNMGDYYITQPGLYAAFTPRGIEFTHWSTGGKHTILDTTTNIDAGQDAVIAFAWNSETLFENFRATMAIFVNDVLTSHYSLGKAHPDSLRNLYAGRASSSHANLCLLGAQSEKNHLLGSLRRIELYSSLDEPYYYDEPSSSSVAVPRGISTARTWSAPRADETHLGVSFEFSSSGEALQPLWLRKTNVTSYASPSHAATIYGHLATLSSCTESEAETGVPYGSYTYPVDASWYGSDNLPCLDMGGITRHPSTDTYCTIGRSGNRTIAIISDTYQKNSLHFNGSVKLYRATILGTRVVANSGAVEVVTSVNAQQDTFSWAFKSDTVVTVITFELDWEIGEAVLGSTSSSTTSQSLSSQTSSPSSSSTADLYTSSSSKSYDRQCSSAALPFSFEAVKGSPVKNVAADFYSVFSANVNVAALTGVPPDFYSVDAGAAVTGSSVPERAGIVRGGKVSDAGER